MAGPTAIDPTGQRSPVLLLKWLIIGIVAALSGLTVVGSFVFLLHTLHDLLWSSAVPLPVFALAGALFIGTVIYRIDPRCAGEGVPSYVHGLRTNLGRLDFSETAGKYLAALATLGTFGSGGIVGPVGRVSAGVMSSLARLARSRWFDQGDLATATTAGLAAAVAVIFRSPIGAGVLAVEIMQKSEMRYLRLFPAIIASALATHLAVITGTPPLIQAPLHTLPAPATAVHPELLLPVLLVAVVTGLGGRAYSVFYGFVSRVAGRRERGSVVFKVLIGTLIAAGIGWLINPVIMGTSETLIADLAAGRSTSLYGNVPYAVPMVVVLLLLAVVKMGANCITVGSGLSAGFTGPAAVIGMLIGRAVAETMGTAAGSLEYYAVLAAGFTGMLASTLNIPFAAAIIALEIFGIQHGVAAGLTAVIAFQLNRRKTIYDSSLGEEPGYNDTAAG
ncbi:MAG: chloride channel protein [Spirochaetia bacterium]